MSCGKFSGAGVLVIEVPHSGEELNIVVFRDKKKKAFTDPGGKCEKHHNDPKETALAELYEETATLIDAQDALSSGYVEKQIGKRRKWYRAYFLFTQPIRKLDYLHNLKKLKGMKAPKHLQETDGMVRVRLSELYKKLILDYNGPYVYDTQGNEIKLHRRLIDVLQVVFRSDKHSKEPWILKVLLDSPYGQYTKTKDDDGLIHYTYKGLKMK